MSFVEQPHICIFLRIKVDAVLSFPFSTKNIIEHYMLQSQNSSPINDSF